MKLGSKILLLTLAIALGLAGVIIWVVSENVAGHEVARAEGAIDSAVSEYFDRINGRHRQVSSIVRLLLGEPGYRSLLVNLESPDPERRELTTTQLREEILGRTLQNELALSDGTSPSFHVILNADGDVVMTGARGNQALAETLSAGRINWPHEAVIERPAELTNRYVWAAGKLYLAMGVPLSMEAGEDAEPTHAYFAGYRVDDLWARLLLGRGEAGAPAGEGDAVSPDLRAWFFVDGNVVARSATPGAGAGAGTNDAEQAVSAAALQRSAGAPGDLSRLRSETAGGEEFIGRAVAFEPAPGVRGTLAVASSLTESLKPLRRLQRNMFVVTFIAAVLAVVAFRVVSEFIARPVRALVAGTQRVATGDFETPIVLDRRDEFGELARGFNSMAAGLRQREFIRDTFGKFVDPKIVDMLLADKSRVNLGGERRVQTVMFSDLANFTRVAEKLEPEDLVGLLNAYLGDAADVVTASQGIVDKFVGDAVVAFWGPPVADDHAARACLAALKCVHSAARHAPRCAALGVEPLNVRVGIATGEVIVGNMGSTNKLNYTVIGDTANLGSRLEGLNKVYHTNILVSPATAAQAARVVITRKVDRVRVVGRAEPVELFEVLAERGSDEVAAGRAAEVRDAYAAALARYDARDWAGARAAFERVATEFNDEASRVMAKRCAAFERRDPGSEWDGVWVAEVK